MTNRKTTIQIVKRFYRESLGDIDLSLMIEKALNEAYLTGFNDMKAKAIEESKTNPLSELPSIFESMQPDLEGKE